ncbi:S1C family serine protease [Novosphingobium tardum]|uniref:S1C family serine protease n=1 Tax=Novosphingobium tardum TaxID=1538021 RepID=A0ABV8RPY0_9SPHN
MLRAAFLLILLLLAGPARAEPSDIAAAGRGVVRVVLVSNDGGSVQYVGHGSGFAVAPDLVVTNAHVVAPLQQDDTMIVGVVPSEGSSGYMAKVVAYSPRNDLALLKLTDKGAIPALTLFQGAVADGAEVYAVGYPGNVDQAQGLSLAEIVAPQAAVKTRGYMSAGRSSREFDTLLHTAPVGSGNSGGPLLDSCGRVIGVNSFGTLSEGADSEFYFAVSMREVATFLRQAGVQPRVSGMPCRSIAELDAAETKRQQADRLQADAIARQQADRLALNRSRATREAEFAVLDERDNGLALALLLAMFALAAGGTAALYHQREDRRSATIAGAVAAGLLIGAGLAWLSRPSLASIDERAAEALAAPSPTATGGVEQPTPGAGALTCIFDPERSRATVSDVADVALDWSADGCVNGRTQYGLANDGWSRILVPNDEATISLNAYDPKTRTYRVERYLMALDAMTKARAARSGFTPPKCGVGESAARAFGANQSAIRALLPPSPNERLVYHCQPAPGTDR